MLQKLPKFPARPRICGILRGETFMLQFKIFKSDELRQTYGSAGITDAVNAATLAATDWMNANAADINVRYVSTGVTSVYAYVTVWHEPR
jgi:hypothetical protein